MRKISILLITLLAILSANTANGSEHSADKSKLLKAYAKFTKDYKENSLRMKERAKVSNSNSDSKALTLASVEFLQLAKTAEKYSKELKLVKSKVKVNQYQRKLVKLQNSAMKVYQKLRSSLPVSGGDSGNLIL
jgi:hypothetical protein